MTAHLAALVTTTAFAALALVHVYWAMGGRRGGGAAVPEENGKPTFRPGRGATLVVALLLAAAGALVGLRGGLWVWSNMPPWIPIVGTWGVAAVTLARFVGDFRYVGVFKRVRGTRFARLDTALYSPLCLALSLGCVVVSTVRT